MQAINVIDKNIDELITMISSGTTDERNSAAEMLVGKGQEAVQKLINLLSEQNRDIRDVVIWALCEIEENIETSLQKSLTSDNSTIIEGAAYILGIKKSKDSVLHLIPLLKHQSPETRQSAAWSLVRIGTPSVPALIEALSDNSIIVQELAIWSLTKIGEPAVVPLLKSFSSFNPDMQIMIEELLLHFSEEMEETFIIYLDTEDRALKLSLLRLIGNSNNSRSIEILIDHLKSDIRSIRQQAVLSLSRADETVIPVIFRAIATGRISIDDDIISLITRIRKPAVPYLLEFLCDPQLELRIMAAKALGIIKDRRSLEPLILSLEDKNTRVRETAARALEMMEHPAAVQPLMKLLMNNTHPIVVSNTIHALAKLADKDTVCHAIDNFHSMDYIVQERLIQLLGHYNCEKSETIMIESLKSDNEDIRRYAVRSLGRCGNERSIEYLKTVIIDDINIISDEARTSLKSIQDRLKRNNL